MSKIIHQLGTCRDCGMTWGGYRNGNARKRAKAHAKKTGHRVFGETGTSWSYEFKQTTSNPEQS